MDWAVDKKLISREKAIFMGKQLVSKKFGTTTDVLEEFMVRKCLLYHLFGQIPNVI